MPPRFAYAGFMILGAAVFLLVRQFIPSPKAIRALPWYTRFSLAGAGLVGGMFGAKLPFLLNVDPDSPFWLADGKTITTGLIGAYLSVELVKWILGIRVKTGDTFALPLALAVAVGRWGCYFFGCCYGQPTDLPWGVDFGDGICRHPTQIYESIFHFILAGIIALLMFKKWLPGHRLQLYLIAYGIYRFVTEFVRPEPSIYLGLTYYQWTSAVLALGLTWQWIFEARRERRENSINSETPQ